ncbi:MAG: methionyl-tRNA formyltransferase [Oligoflexales bacterium]
MRVVFLGSPACVIPPLESLLASNHEVVAVVSQPASKQGRGRKVMDPAVAEFAKQKGIEVLQPMKASDPDFLARFSALQPDVAITAAYGQILTKKFLEIPKRGTINIHPSLLPKHRGATPVQNTLLEGDAKTGVSILFTVQALDAGNIICQTEQNVAPEATAEDLLHALFIEGGSQVLMALQHLENPLYVGVEQDESLITLCKKIHKKDGQILWSESAQKIYQRFKAYQPWPGLYSFLEGRRIVFSDVKVSSQSFSETIGQGRWEPESGVLRVQCAKGSLEVYSVKPEGKKLMKMHDFCNGRKNKEYFFTVEVS